MPRCIATKDGSSAARLRVGDIVFARTGATTGKSHLIRQCPEDAVFASYLIRVRLKDEVDPAFVSYYFRTPDYWAQIAGSSRGAAQLGVNATTLSSLKVPLPSLAAQRRIAAILDQAEALRTQRRAAIELLDELVKSMFMDMFGDPRSNPKNWPVRHVGEVADVQGGLQVTSARSKLPLEVPYLRVANVFRGRPDLSEVKTIRATRAEVARAALRNGDLLVVEGHGNPDEVGRAALWTGAVAPCVHQNHLIRVRFQGEMVLPVFACEYLNSPGGRQHLLRSGKTTSGLNTISVSNVREAPIALPPPSLQRSFAQRIEMIDSLRSFHRASLAHLNALFASLQHRAFRGEL